MVLFGGLVCAAIANVRRPEIHKRLMLLATISVIPPAIARVFFALNVGIAPGLRPGLGPLRTVESVLAPALIADALVLAGMICDWRTRGRPHPAYVIGGVISSYFDGKSISSIQQRPSPAEPREKIRDRVPPLRPANRRAEDLHGDHGRSRSGPHQTTLGSLKGGEATGILTADMKRVVGEQRLGFVATVCPDGTPNLSPKGTTAVWDDDHLIFANIRSPGTLANLRQNANVEVNVVDTFVRKGYRFKGVGSILESGALYEKALAFYRERGSRSAIREIVIIRVQTAQSIDSPAYDLGLTEDEVRDRWERHFHSLRSGKTGSQTGE